MSLSLKKHLVHIFLIAVLLGAVINSFFVYQKKQGLFVDEIYSFYVANYRITSFKEFSHALSTNIDDYLAKQRQLHPLTTPISKKELIDRCSVNNGDEYGFFNTYCLKSIADQHPPLYYLILHTISSIKHSKEFKLVGYSINVLFLILICILIYLIVNNIFKHKIMAAFSVAFYAFSFECTDSVSYCRMYVMSAFFLMATLYMYLKIYDLKAEIKTKHIIILCTIEYLGMLTHYFCAFYFLPLFIWGIYYLKGNTIYRKKFIVLHVIMGIFYLLTWPQSLVYTILGISQRSALGAALGYRTIAYGYNIVKSFFYGNIVYFGLSLLLFLCFFIWSRRRKFNFQFNKISKQEKSFLVFVPAVVFYFLVTYISPWYASRYVTPVMPIISIIIYSYYWGITNELISFKFLRYLFISCICIFASVIAEINLKHEYFFESTYEKEVFKEKYDKEEAILLDKFNFHNMEAVMNSDHPSYKKVTWSSSDLKENLVKDKYILYWEIYTDTTEIRNEVEKLNYSVSKLEYRTPSLFVYLLEKHQ